LYAGLYAGLLHAEARRTHEPTTGHLATASDVLRATVDQGPSL
jgi:hypothetical protein